MVVVAVASFLQLPGRASAGPVEQLAQVALHPTDPNVMVLRYMNGGDGLLYSDDAGASFKLICLSAIDPMLRRIGTIAVAGDGRLVMGLFDGLLEDQGGGCGFTAVPGLTDTWISDLAVDPTDPQVLYASTSKSMMNGAGAAPNGLYRRDGAGEFSQFGSLETLLITRLRLTSTDAGLRIYQSAIHGTVPGMIDGMPVMDLPNYVIRVSDDGGATFTEFPYGTGDGSAFRLVGVDPSNPDRILAVLDRTQENDELFVSSDRGQTFDSYHMLSQISAVEFAPDGRVFIGEAASSTDPTASVGLWFAASLDESPSKLADYPVACLAYQASTETLFVCQRWAFGTADQTDGAFTERASFKTIDEFVSCEGVDMADSCMTQLCGDYCGLAHFASAGVCQVYDGPFCGRCVAAMENEIEAPGCGGTSGGAGRGGSGGSTGARDGGADSGAGAAGTGASPAAGEGGRGGAAGSAGAGGDDDGDGGCSCSAPGAAARPYVLWWAAGWFALAWIARRRRRGGD